MHWAALVIEAIDRGTEEAKPSQEIYNVGLFFLRQISEGAEAEPLAAHSLLRLICLLGYAPDLREPDGTLNSRDLFFNVEEGRLSPEPPEDLRLPHLRLSPVMRPMAAREHGIAHG